MFGYQHAFHAGNTADVLKHWVLVLCLQYMTEKEKPLFYLDTHAGEGLFSLRDERAQKTLEYRKGIQALQNSNPPPCFEAYLSCVAEFQRQRPDYPGSPAIAASLLRPQDRLALIEWSAAAFTPLQQNFASDRRVQCRQEDGFIALKALLPPKERRGLILMDPSYEIKSDYEKVVTGLQEAVQRFETGVYLLWYPILSDGRSDVLVRKLTRLFPEGQSAVWRHPTLTQSAEGRTLMQGSGLFIINAPWGIKEPLAQGLQWLNRLDVG